MTNSLEPEEGIRLKYEAIRPYLSERGRRLWAAAEAASFGRGGVILVCRGTGLSSATLAKGIKEFNSPKPVDNRVRAKGGGRKKISLTSNELVRAIDKLVDPTAKGDPESSLRWTSKSVRNIERALQDEGYQISYRTVARILQELGLIEKV